MIRRAALVLIALPALLAAYEAFSFVARHRNNGVVVSGGVEREYLLHVPRSYDPAKPAPLVISLHGAGGRPAQQRDITRWNRLADEEGFLVAYPLGGTKRVWRPRDVQFISDLIDQLQATYNIDRRRIYANGLSNGAGMSFLLSCGLSDRIAAVGLVAAAHTFPWSACKDEKAVPMIAFHGTADPITPYEGGRTWVAQRSFPRIATIADHWARRNRCAPSPVESRMTSNVTRREYANCDAPVVLYTLAGAGHTWPGGEPLPEWFVGTTSNEIDATREMWKFFEVVGGR